MSSSRFAFAVLAALVVSTAPACSTDDEGAPATPVTELPQGEFVVGVALAPFGGLVLPYQVVISGRLVEIRASAVDDVTGEAVLSEVLGSVSDVTVAADGTFDLDFPAFVQPGEFTPTGSDVEVDIALAGSVDAASFCGDVTGQIVTFSLDLAGSTFAAQPWPASGVVSNPVSTCGGVTLPVPRLETCPALTAGTVSLESGGTTRTAEVVLPSTYDATRSYPLVFVYHGFGADAASMLDGVGYRAQADLSDVILVAPEGVERGGSTSFDPASPGDTNLDVVFFDDLLKCVGESFAIDQDRVYATGMSNGGLFTGALVATRGDALAAAAPFSGGVIPAFEGDAEPPVIATFGGPTDLAFGQDFDRLNTAMMAALTGRGHYTVNCIHDLGHSLTADMLPWSFEFLLAHTRGAASPLAGAPLPGTFPAWCAEQ